MARDMPGYPSKVKNQLFQLAPSTTKTEAQYRFPRILEHLMFHTVCF